MSDPIRPDHYGGPDNPYETIKVAEAWGLDKDAYLFNVLKYVSRAGKKGPAREDLEKAAFYIDRRIQNLDPEPDGFTFPTEPYSWITAKGHPCEGTTPDGRTMFVLTGAERWMCDCSVWPESTIREDLTDHRNETP